MITECKNLIENNDIKSKYFHFKDRQIIGHSVFVLNKTDLNLMFQLVDLIPNVEPLLADLESYILSEGLMVMRANSETITSVLKKIYIRKYIKKIN